MPSGDVHPLGRLLGGNCATGSNLSTIIEYLANTLTGLISQATLLDFGGQADPRVSILGPYLARGILELGFSILLARLDPFRVLVLRQIQQSSDFEIEVRSNCALQWRGDFLADEKVTDPWKSTRKSKDMTRALLGDYHDQVFWRPSFVNLLDGAPPGRGGQWLTELRLISPEGFAANIRSRAERVYTACSKGVHHEFVIPLSAYYDSQQVLDLLTDVVELCATLGIVMNSAIHIPFCLKTEEAFDYFESIEKEIEEMNA